MLSLDIDGGKIKVLTGKRGRNGIVANGYFHIALEDAASIVDKGMPEHLGGKLKTALNERGIKEKKCAVSLRCADIFSRRYTFPRADKAKLKAMVSHMVNEIPNAWDFYVDYTVLREYTAAGRNMLDVLICGVPKEIAGAWYQMVGEAGLSPYRMDARQNSIHRLIGPDTEINGENLRDKAVLLLEMGNLLSLDLVVNGDSVFERTITVIREISDNLKFLFDGPGYRTDNPLYERIYDESQKMMQFSLTRSFKIPVTRVYIYGDSATESGLTAYLSEALGVPVAAISEMTGIKSGKKYNGPPVCEILGCACALI